MQRYLEFTPPNGELKKDVEAIIKIQPSADIEESLAERGKALRSLQSKWGTQASNGFNEHVKMMIDATDKPVKIGETPQFPNRNAFDSDDPEQMEEYKNKAEEVFNALLDWDRRKQAFATASQEEIDPNHRYMVVGKGLTELNGWLTPLTKKFVTMPSGTKIVCVDDGRFPGHMVAEISAHQKDNEKAKYLGNLNYLADQAGFKTFIPGEAERKEEILQRSDEELRADFKKMTNEKLREVCDAAGKVWTEEMVKRELIELLMPTQEVNDDSEGAEGSMPDNGGGS